MSADGAHLGIKPEDALDVILGDQPQESKERLDVKELEAGIRSAPDQPGSYNAARACCELGPVQNPAIVEVTVPVTGDGQE